MPHTTTSRPPALFAAHHYWRMYRSPVASWPMPKQRKERRYVALTGLSTWPTVHTQVDRQTALRVFSMCLHVCRHRCHRAGSRDPPASRQSAPPAATRWHCCTRSPETLAGWKALQDITTAVRSKRRGHVPSEQDTVQ